MKESTIIENDLEKIKDTISDDLSHYIDKYFEHRKEDLTELDYYIHNKDFEGIFSIAHKILGTAKTFGLLKLDYLAAQLETYSTDEIDLEKIKDLKHHINEYVEEHLNN